MNNLEKYLSQATKGLRGTKKLELREELTNHILEKTHKYQIAGLSQEQALAQAIADLGNPKTIETAMKGVQTMSNLFKASAITLDHINIQGRIGGSQHGYDFRANHENTNLQGRVGGELIGNDLELEILDNQITGQIGTPINGYTIKAQIQNNTLIGRIGGQTIGEDIRLEQQNQRITGRIGGKTLGQDINLEILETSLTGRIGGKTEGNDVKLHSSNPQTPALLLALCATLISKILGTGTEDSFVPFA